MSYLNVLKEIDQGKVANTYLLYGTESYFIQNIIDKLLTAVLGEEIDNMSAYDLSETPIQDVLQDAEIYPFFGDRKVIIASDATFLQARPAKLPFEHDIDSLIRYIKQPSDTTVLVITAPYDSIDGRKKITRQLKKHAKSIECASIKDDNIENWIMTFLKEENLQIEKEAVELLVANLPNNLQLIQNELRKFASYVEPDGIITKDVVLKLISHLPTNTALELADTVINRDLAKAMYIYRDLKLNNESPIALIGLLAYQFRILLQVKLLKRKGYSEYQMRNKISAHPYVIKIANNRERRFTFESLKWIINQLTETDAKIKSGKMDENLAFEQLLFHLITAA